MSERQKYVKPEIQNEQQAKRIRELWAERASLRKEIKRLKLGQAKLRAILSPKKPPRTQDEWEWMVRQAVEEIEAENV